MTFEIFMMGLLLVSVLTGLFTEAIKGWLLERGKKFYCNALTGYVAAGVVNRRRIAFICAIGLSGFFQPPFTQIFQVLRIQPRFFFQVPHRHPTKF